MRARVIALSLAALFILAASPARAGEPREGTGLLAGGIAADIGSTGTGAACAALLTQNIGRQLDNGGPNDGQAFAVIAAVCSLNVALGAAGIAMTVVGAKKLEKGRALHYSLNSLAVRF
jgi:hypothetical protein